MGLVIQARLSLVSARRQTTTHFGSCSPADMPIWSRFDRVGSPRQSKMQALRRDRIDVSVLGESPNETKPASKAGRGQERFAIDLAELRFPGPLPGLWRWRLPSP